MSKEKRVDVLKAVAEHKKQDALDSTEKAINKLIREGKRVSFGNVAREAGVSVSYLYKYPEIKERIQQLRTQQEQTNKASIPQPASDKSKMVIVNQLKERIKKLEAEKDGLRRAIEGLTGRLYQYQGMEEQLERFKAENTDLKQQLEECRRHAPPPSPAADNSKVVSLEKKRSKKSSGSDKIKSELDALKIKANSTLLKLIGQAPEEVILRAIDTLKEALTTSTVRNPSGFLVAAIRITWIPNERFEQKVELNAFNEWYLLAHSKKLVEAATQIEGVQHVCTPEGEWIPFEEMVAKYPLERMGEMT
jgi:DNA repair exonuclease SbcCD ATPase subunit